MAGSEAGALSVQKTRATDLGPNVKVFDPSMATADIQAAVDAVSQQQLGNQFGSERYTLLFKPGTYGTAAHPLIVQVSYYNEVAVRSVGVKTQEMLCKTAILPF